MNIQKNVPLKEFSTMRLGGKAAALVEINDKHELKQAIAWAKANNLPFTVIGSGSNVIFTDKGYDGLIIINRLVGIESFKKSPNSSLIKAQSGETWDYVVKFSVEHGLTGIEAMSLVPGTAGAAPVQNIGAYGQQLSDSFVELEAYDTETEDFVTLKKDDCGFLYRSSIFKSDHPDTQKGRYVITALTLQLKKGQMKPPFYTTLQRFLDENKITDYSPASIRKAVIAWRSDYLPNPNTTANVGSFFKNPIITRVQLDSLLATNPELSDIDTRWYWELEDGTIKVAAGRLAEVAGLKDWHDKTTGMGTWSKQALILVNEHAQSYANLETFVNKYLNTIKTKYGIEFEKEPEVIS